VQVCGCQTTRCCRLSTGQRRSVRRNPPAGDVGRELDPSTWSAESTTVTAVNTSDNQQQHRPKETISIERFYVNVCMFKRLNLLHVVTQNVKFSYLLSQICLSSITFVHSTQPVEIFGHISTPFCTLAICSYEIIPVESNDTTIDSLGDL